MVENLISRSPGSLISVFLPLLSEQKNMRIFGLLFVFFHRCFNIDLVALGLLWIGCPEAAVGTLLRHCALWQSGCRRLLLKHQHSSVMISVKTKNKWQRSFNKNLFYRNVCDILSHTESPFICRPLGGDICVGSWQVSITEVWLRTEERKNIQCGLRIVSITFNKNKTFFSVLRIRFMSKEEKVNQLTPWSCHSSNQKSSGVTLFFCLAHT